MICIFEVGSNFFLARAVVKTWASDADNSTMTTTVITPSLSTLEATRRTTTEKTSDSTTTTTTASETFSFDEIPLGYLIAIGTALIGSIVPLFTGLILYVSLFGCCLYLAVRNCRRPYLRFISLNCNCPCYTPRLKLRFTIRIVFHIFCILLRMIATMMYGILYMAATTDIQREVIYLFLLITGVSLIFPFLTILLDVYHYRVWWAYKPDINISSDILDKPFSHKHKRFIPYVLTEAYRTQTIGNRTCQYGNRCENRQLEHVVIFHSTGYQPQLRWTVQHKVYIGFHQTKPETAFKIAKSDFLPSAAGMLGPGAYFARSMKGTERKVGHKGGRGAMFVAEIEMGKVYEAHDGISRGRNGDPRFDPREREYVMSGAWANDYDTCYFRHFDESQDEFCIKDPEKQIRRWVVFIEGQYDRKLNDYRLFSELDSSMCGCI